MAASALLIDYVLTVAVSISSASEQIISAMPGARALARRHRASCSSSLITLANLRGLRESGNIFAVPTYLFVGAALLMIGLGAWQILVEGAGRPYPPMAEAAADLTAPGAHPPRACAPSPRAPWP